MSNPLDPAGQLFVRVGARGVRKADEKFPSSTVSFGVEKDPRANEISQGREERATEMPALVCWRTG